ncbi:hypothetical protein [Leisingera sp. HS039]|uniref:hypothetical protein n=1 Tax=Leisingera sp. HS039 TaxID=2818496 RepID=UPI001B39F1A9|nr:hypothetical protein [Leisingera sp. HS039]
MSQAISCTSIQAALDGQFEQTHLENLTVRHNPQTKLLESLQGMQKGQKRSAR